MKHADSSTNRVKSRRMHLHSSAFFMPVQPVSRRMFSEGNQLFRQVIFQQQGGRHHREQERQQDDEEFGGQ